MILAILSVASEFSAQFPDLNQMVDFLLDFNGRLNF